ncbi:MAG TPA: argininosuccinate lyase, partial [Acetobacteraceae bacterium]|nr:argininosuccinate lyase [Acetobacteraceae bacterium]
EKFTAPAYARTVLAPLFEGYQRHFREHLIAVHHAHGIMLRERGWLTAEQAGTIFAAIADAVAANAGKTLDYTGEHEDYFFWLEAQLADRIGRDVAGRLHTGRSRNDIDHTILRMVMRERLLGILAQLHRLIATLIRRAEENIDTLVVAYTHGQPAQPTTFAHYLGAFIETLLRDADRLLHAYATADRCPLGAAAITTSGFKLDRARTAELLGFGAVQENAYGCIAGVDHIAETFGALKTMLLGIGRFVQDLNAWTSFEVGHVHVPDAFVQISSIMPQKRNPVPIEHLRLQCSLAAGRADAILLTLHNTPFADMNDSEGPVHEAGYEAFDTVARVLDLLDALMAAVTIDEARVRTHIDQACVTITELADSLVRREGISFRQAHEIAAHLARVMIAEGATLANLPMATFTSAFSNAIGRAPSITEAEFRQVCTPEHFIAVRDMFGGPARMDESLEGYRAALSDGQRRAAAHRARIDRAGVLRKR